MKIFLLLLMTVNLLNAGERTQVHMGTLISVQIADENLSDAVFALFHDLDQRLSTYKDDSEISCLNRDHEANLSDITRDVLERSIVMSRLSHGAFDITIGSLSHGAYRFGKEERLPSKGELKEALTHVGIDKLRLQGNRAFLSSGSVIDLGGIGKGYAVDLAIKLLTQHGVGSAVIAASGDIGCIGPCDVSIADPFHPDAVFAALHSSLSRFAISTSGNYERYIRSKEHNHLLNPKTGISEQRFASVTLVDNGDNTRIDALATAVSVMEVKEAIALLEEQKIAYLLIENNGNVFQSQMPEGVVFKKVR